MIIIYLVVIFISIVFLKEFVKAFGPMIVSCVELFIIIVLIVAFIAMAILSVPLSIILLRDILSPVTEWFMALFDNFHKACEDFDIEYDIYDITYNNIGMLDKRCERDQRILERFLAKVRKGRLENKSNPPKN